MKPRVLIVDDSLTYRGELAEYLADEGYDVRAVASGDEALELLHREQVDCVCLDMLMPGLSGEETCRRIKRDAELRALPVVMLTAQEGVAAILSCLQAGADDFVAKSGEMVVLKARLDAQLRRRHFEDENRRIREELLSARVEAARANADRELAETRARFLQDLEAKNAQLEREKSRAEEAVRVRDEFLQIASHELKTPLTSLTLQLQSIPRLLEKLEDPAAARLAAKIDLATKQAERLHALAENLLDVSRIHAGALLLTPERFDLAEAVRAVVHRFEDEAARADAPLVLRAEGPLNGAWDRARVEQLVGNLLSNAVKYGRGAPIEITLAREDGAAKLAVRDHGMGVAEEDLGRIFERFERACSWRNFGGLGLGLYIARQIAAAHGGVIRARGAPDRGTIFEVELPIRQGAPAGARGEEAA